jgi:hypothetical protein
VTGKYIIDASKVTTDIFSEEDLPFSTTDDFTETQYTTVPPLVSVDPYEAYLSALAPGETPNYTITKESHTLHVINPSVDNKEDIPGIVDPDSQIITIAEDVCHQLSIPYNLTICLNMQSANGSIDWTLRLAHNVKCHISNIFVFLQLSSTR